MKQILLLVILFTSLATFSQSMRQHLGIAVGPSFALSDFAKTDSQDSTLGSAKTGVNLKIMYSYRITHNFGIKAHFVYNSNFLDVKAINSAKEEKYPPYSFSTQSYESWSAGGLYVGPFLRFPITDNFIWEVRALIGLTGGYSPKYIIRGTNTETGEKTEYFRESGKSLGFGVTAGTGFKYIIGKYLILLNADYYYSNLNFKDVSGWGWTNADNTTGTPYNLNIKQKINTVSLTIGVAYFL